MDCLIFCLLSNEYKNELQNIFSRAFDCYEICNLILDLFLVEQNNYMSLSYIVRFFKAGFIYYSHTDRIFPWDYGVENCDVINA